MSARDEQHDRLAELLAEINAECEEPSDAEDPLRGASESSFELMTPGQRSSASSVYENEPEISSDGVLAGMEQAVVVPLHTDTGRRGSVGDNAERPTPAAHDASDASVTNSVDRLSLSSETEEAQNEVKEASLSAGDLRAGSESASTPNPDTESYDKDSTKGPDESLDKPVKDAAADSSNSASSGRAAGHDHESSTAAQTEQVNKVRDQPIPDNHAGLKEPALPELAPSNHGGPKESVPTAIAQEVASGASSGMYTVSGSSIEEKSPDSDEPVRQAQGKLSLQTPQAAKKSERLISEEAVEEHSAAAADTEAANGPKSAATKPTEQPAEANISSEGDSDKLSTSKTQREATQSKADTPGPSNHDNESKLALESDDSGSTAHASAMSEADFEEIDDAIVGKQPEHIQTDAPQIAVTGNENDSRQPSMQPDSQALDGTDREAVSQDSVDKSAELVDHTQERKTPDASSGSLQEPQIANSDKHESKQGPESTKEEPSINDKAAAEKYNVKAQAETASRAQGPKPESRAKTSDDEAKAKEPAKDADSDTPVSDAQEVRISVAETAESGESEHPVIKDAASKGADSDVPHSKQLSNKASQPDAAGDKRLGQGDSQVNELESSSEPSVDDSQVSEDPGLVRPDASESVASGASDRLQHKTHDNDLSELESTQDQAGRGAAPKPKNQASINEDPEFEELNAENVSSQEKSAAGLKTTGSVEPESNEGPDSVNSVAECRTSKGSRGQLQVNESNLSLENPQDSEASLASGQRKAENFRNTETASEDSSAEKLRVEGAKHASVNEHEHGTRGEAFNAGESLIKDDSPKESQDGHDAGTQVGTAAAYEDTDNKAEKAEESVVEATERAGADREKSPGDDSSTGTASPSADQIAPSQASEVSKSSDPSSLNEPIPIAKSAAGQSSDHIFDESEASSTADNTEAPSEDTNTVYLYMSFASGVRGAMSRYNRAVGILESYEIKFVPVEITMNERAKRLWKYKGANKNKVLPAVFRDGDLKCDYNELLEANEYEDVEGTIFDGL